MAAKRRVFDSVFESSNAISQPTPDTDFTAPGQPFGGPVAFTHDRTQAPASFTRGLQFPMIPSAEVRDQFTWDRSWHTVTSFLAYPHTPAGFFDLDAPLHTPIPAFHTALRDILEPDTRLPYASQTEDLTSWYSQQVCYHFIYEIIPLLQHVSEHSEPEEVLPNYLKILEKAHRLYLHRLSFIVRQLDDSNPGASKSVIQRFQRDLHAVVSNSISARVSGTMKAILAQKISIVLEVPPLGSVHPSRNTTLARSPGSEREKVRGELLALVESLYNVGFGGEYLKISLAEVITEALSNYVKRTYSRIWSRTSSKREAVYRADHPASEDASIAGGGSGHVSTSNWTDGSSLVPRDMNHGSPSPCVRDLCEWIENQYSRLAVEVLQKLDKTEVAWNDVEKWKKMSIGRLAGLRTQELFDIVVNWPDSNGALDDLRTAVTTPERRLQLTDVFSTSLKERLLHSGASTLQILRTYISMIWSFHSLDRSRVLLDRVAYPLQVYLCSREDTVKIIITGLLSDTEDASGNPIEPGGDKLVELAILLNKGSKQLGQRVDEDLDWNDMDWVPDPVDAGPGYKRSKSADVIGTLIGVLGSQEVFIKEFQNIIGENLLKSEGDFEKEMKLLELLKTRFGEAPLQSCEVMIKDIQDSRRVDGVIRRNQRLDPSEQEIDAARKNSDILKKDHTSAEGLLKPSLHAKILSRLFWPQLHDGSYRVPDDIAKLQQRYEQGFESLKNSRKLTWLHGLGQATVELELHDRVVLEEVHTWQATVIWAFQSNHGRDSSLTRSVEELVERLEMDEALVRSALKFWVSKVVLREIRKDEFAVLETLNQEDRARSNAQAMAATTATESSPDDTALMSNNELTSEKMQVYWQFIQGMLTNSSPQMPLQQIAMMLKMLIADGFPYSTEELQEFLGLKVAARELELVKGKYRLKK